MRAFIANIAAAVFSIAPVYAADLYSDPLPPITEPEGFEARWEFNAAIYLWATGINGTVGYDTAAVGPVTGDVDASFSDLLENLDFAFMVAGEARYDRFGIFHDFIYTDLSADGSASAGPGPGVKATIDNQMFIGTFMGEYRVVDAGSTSVDLMAGARIYHVNLDTTVKGPFAARSGGFDKTWVDPMIGAKTRLQGASPWYLTGWAMIGGFGVSSDIAWDVFGGIGYEVSDRISLVGGYRAMGVDYETSDFKFDVIMDGPVIGGVFRF